MPFNLSRTSCGRFSLFAKLRAALARDFNASVSISERARPSLRNAMISSGTSGSRAGAGSAIGSTGAACCSGLISGSGWAGCCCACLRFSVSARQACAMPASWLRISSVNPPAFEKRRACLAQTCNSGSDNSVAGRVSLSKAKISAGTSGAGCSTAGAATSAAGWSTITGGSSAMAGAKNNVNARILAAPTLNFMSILRLISQIHYPQYSPCGPAVGRN